MSDMQGKLLVVDDNEMNRDMLSRRLSRRKHNVITAENGQQALDLIEKESFDVILLDIMMPGMDGYEVCRKIRQDPAYSLVRIIFVSGRAMVFEQQEGYKAGADAYLTQPFDEDELLAALKGKAGDSC